MAVEDRVSRALEAASRSLGTPSAPAPVSAPAAAAPQPQAPSAPDPQWVREELARHLAREAAKPRFHLPTATRGVHFPHAAAPWRRDVVAGLRRLAFAHRLAGRVFLVGQIAQLHHAVGVPVDVAVTDRRDERTIAAALPQYHFSFLVVPGVPGEPHVEVTTPGHAGVASPDSAEAADARRAPRDESGWLI